MATVAGLEQNPVGRSGPLLALSRGELLVLLLLLLGLSVWVWAEQEMGALLRPREPRQDAVERQHGLAES